MRILLALILMLCLGVGWRAAAADSTLPDERLERLPDAAQDCLDCHNEPDLVGILQTPHASVHDARTGFAESGCASCHGASHDHMRRPARGQPRTAPDRVFGSHSALTATEQNKVCSDCHRIDAGMHWLGSAHEAANLRCSDCHTSHAAQDPALDKANEPAVCGGCHQQQRAEMLRPSAHPLHDGRMGCSDCHAAHGGVGTSLLIGGNVNETCYTCHAELRGPFLWEHPPAREDCMNCHRPHGSVHPAMLTQRTPFLCQQCHLAQFHPSAALSGTGLPGDSLPSGSQSLLGKDCQNCHAQVHGSNHPSGASTTR